MTGARFKWCTGPALAAAVAVLTFGGPAQAADFGGDCCADLEERIAELEATTVRKGNRKVSLTVTGWVSSAVLFWDDGEEQNAYVVSDSTDLASNVAFTGSAQITSDWSAGYLINVFFDTGNALVVNQDNDDVDFGVNVDKSFWFLKSNTYGKLSVGLQSGAGDNSALGTDFTGTLFQHNNVSFEGMGFALRPDGGTRTAVFAGLPAANLGPEFGFVGQLSQGLMGSFFGCISNVVNTAGDCRGSRTNAVRYDTPTFGGFSASASWGEDDAWEYALRYAGEGAGLKFSAAVNYNLTNGDGNFSAVTGAPIDAELFQVGATLKHLQSALWVHGTYLHDEADNPTIDSSQAWYAKVGWSPRLNTLGTTHFVFEYGQNLDSHGLAYERGSGGACAGFGGTGGSNIGAACAGAGLATDIDVTDSTGTRIGAGIIQEIDAASMNVYAKWRQLDVEFDFQNTATGATGSQDFDELNLFMVGGFIFF